jgi:hypothetical protein
MKRREFLKSIAATAAVGAVAPKLLLAPPPAAMGVDTSMNVYRLGMVGRTAVTATMNPANPAWEWTMTILKPRPLTGQFRGYFRSLADMFSRPGAAFSYSKETDSWG